MKNQLFSLRETALWLRSQRSFACARRCRSSWLTGWWIRNRIIWKIEGRGGGEAQGVTDPPKNLASTNLPLCRLESHLLLSTLGGKEKSLRPTIPEAKDPKATGPFRKWGPCWSEHFCRAAPHLAFDSFVAVLQALKSVVTGMVQL
jgi:hypothetical protein